MPGFSTKCNESMYRVKRPEEKTVLLSVHYSVVPEVGGAKVLYTI